MNPLSLPPPPVSSTAPPPPSSFHARPPLQSHSVWQQPQHPTYPPPRPHDPIPLDTLFNDDFPSPLPPVPDRDITFPLPSPSQPLSDPSFLPSTAPTLTAPTLNSPPLTTPPLSTRLPPPFRPTPDLRPPPHLSQPPQQPSITTATTTTTTTTTLPSEPPHHPPLTLSDPDALSPAQRRRLRTELRRARTRRNPHNPPPRARERPTHHHQHVPSSDMAPMALDKKAARVIRNREVALRARQAAKNKMKNLETENFSLKNRASHLAVENSSLKTQIEVLIKQAPEGTRRAWEAAMDNVVVPATQ